MITNFLSWKILLFIGFFGCVITSEEIEKKPTVLIGILVRNKAHTLPYFFTYLERLEYPKDRISLWIQSDNNVDNSIEILKVWLKEQESNYDFVTAILDEKSKGISDENGLSDWSITRFNHVIDSREKILKFGRKIRADYLLMLDSDVFLTNPNILELLISKNKTVVAPLLKSDGMYSNFWAGMTAAYYYERTEKYIPILNREEPGCYDVPMAHSAILINLNKEESKYLTYQSDKLNNYDGPRDDIIIFALGAKTYNIPLFICNDQVYGFVMVPLENGDNLDRDYQQITNLKLEMLSHVDEIPLSNSMKNFVNYPKKEQFDYIHKIFMINLKRRPDRRARMNRCFDELGIEAEAIDAIDGNDLTPQSLEQLGIHIMPEYIDPYRKRPMTMGEVGCFLSHYTIWNSTNNSEWENIIVLEDDVRFEPFFKNKVNFIMNELLRLEYAGMNWDLVYLGRKRMQEQDEPFIEGSNNLVYAGYSYWTLGYILSRNGARKLIETNPLQSLVPVDEFLPIMFDKHPRTNWKTHFEKRNLIALSAVPLLVYPTHYTGENGYISDTENSYIIDTGNHLDGNKKTEL